MTTYIQDAIRTESIPDIQPSLEQIRLLHAAMGLSTESGEFVDAMKKNIFYGKPIDRTNLKEELGDLFWYMAIAADALGTTFEELQRVNIEKLKFRYPDKFDAGYALARNLAEERRILEEA